MLEKKRKREDKRKAVALDQPPKGKSVDLVSDSDVAVVKRTSEDDVLIASHDIFVEDMLQLSFPLDNSFFSEPKGLLAEARKCLLPKDEK